MKVIVRMAANLNNTKYKLPVSYTHLDVYKRQTLHSATVMSG